MLNKNIRIEMVRYDLTIEQLAKELGISSVSLSNKMNGKRSWTLAEAKRLVDIFNARGSNHTIDTLFYDNKKADIPNAK